MEVVTASVIDRWPIPYLMGRTRMNYIHSEIYRWFLWWGLEFSACYSVWRDRSLPGDSLIDCCSIQDVRWEERWRWPHRRWLMGESDWWRNLLFDRPRYHFHSNSFMTFDDILTFWPRGDAFYGRLLTYTTLPHHAVEGKIPFLMTTFIHYIDDSFRTSVPPHSGGVFDPPKGGDDSDDHWWRLMMTMMDGPFHLIEHDTLFIPDEAGLEQPTIHSLTFCCLMAHSFYYIYLLNTFSVFHDTELTCNSIDTNCSVYSVERLFILNTWEDYASLDSGLWMVCWTWTW